MGERVGKPMADSPIRIAVRLPDSGYMGRILLGALRATHARNWIVGLGENAPDFMLRCGMRGMIGSAIDRPGPLDYERAGIPYVSVLRLGQPGCVAGVILDHHQIGRLAGEHLLERGFRHFGFVGYPIQGTERRIGFREAIGTRARSFSVCPVAYHNTPEEFDAMLSWLTALPKPVGVFAADDPIGGAVTEVCQLGRIAVPSEVAVVSVNDDGVRTLASEPELTSVRVPWERVGTEAVHLLAEHLTDPRAARRSSILPPSGIAVRGSSDILVMSDAEAAAAAAFIQQNAHRQITVDQVADATTISRRLLERRFKAATGRTLLGHIRRTRLDRARQMLTDSTLRVSDVAKVCGFGTRAQFHRLFQHDTGATPHEYRQRNRDASCSNAPGNRVE